MNPDLTPELTGAQFEAKFAQVKNLKSMSNQPKPVFKQRHVLEKEHLAALAEIAELKAKPGGQRASSAELDRLRAENASIQAKIAATGKPAPAKPATLTAAAYLASVAKPTMTRAEFSRLPRGEQGKAIKTITLVP